MQFALSAEDWLEAAVAQLDLDDLKRTDAALTIIDEAVGGDRVQPVTALLVRTGDLVGHGVGRPRLPSRALLGRVREDLELGHRRCALPVRGAEAVGPGVPTAEDHDVLSGRIDRGDVEVTLLHAVGAR